jgi:glucose/arabinose dehydrogenase
VTLVPAQGEGLPAGLHLPSGFAIARVAQVPGARHLAALPNGDLLVATSSSDVYIVADALADAPGAASVFLTLPDAPAQSVALSPDGHLYVASQHGLWRLGYVSGQRQAAASDALEVAHVRTGAIAPGSDGDVHSTSSVAAGADAVFVSVGSSCNACAESDPTRAAILRFDPDGSHMTTLATRIRNGIALALDPQSGHLWVGDAGQDGLPAGHPYELVDDVTGHPERPVDYGWPECEENRVAYKSGADCSHVAVPALVYTAYATHIGAAFYPIAASGAHAFPKPYAGGLFVTQHGSWHSAPATPPAVSFAAMNGAAPCVAVDWQHPTAQWTPFISGLGTPDSTHYSARPTGLAVASDGSLFFADDQNGAVYRIRPSARR